MNTKNSLNTILLSVVFTTLFIGIVLYRVLFMAQSDFQLIDIAIFISSVLAVFLIPWAKRNALVAIIIVLILCLFVFVFFQLVSKSLVLAMILPLLGIIVGFFEFAGLKSYFKRAMRHQEIVVEIRLNKQLAIDFLKDGLLDKAFERLLAIPMEDEIKEIYFQIGIAYESAKQFDKAVEVYDALVSFDADYKNASNRRTNLLEANHTFSGGENAKASGELAGDLQKDTKDGKIKIGRYEIIKKLGQGAMGIVYLATDPNINRTVAIKTFCFSEDYSEAEAQKVKTTFFKEAESAGTLNHPNIVTIYDAGESQNVAYIAMEYLEGYDLDAHTNKKNLLQLRKVIDCIADIADGLNYAHEKGIVHRDIKPSNIMLLKSGLVKITDFGVARITATSQTKTGVVKGTPHYMSPEQFYGEKVDGRSDIFSLGVMMFKLLTGISPFQATSTPALMNKIMNEPHPNPQQYNPRIIKPLVKVIDRALEKDRQNRFQNAMEMATKLRKIGKEIDVLLAKQKRGK